MITNDFNFVNVDFYIEYQIVDPVKAYINSDTAISILRNLAQSYIRDTVGSYAVDEVITTGKAEIQAKVKAPAHGAPGAGGHRLRHQQRDHQDVEPPRRGERRLQGRGGRQAGHGHQAERGEKVPVRAASAANAKADKALRDAEAYKQQRISEAEGQVSRFNDMYDEYVKYPLITKKRMFYETMEEVLPSLKVIINSSGRDPDGFRWIPLWITARAPRPGWTERPAGQAGPEPRRRRRSDEKRVCLKEPESWFCFF